MYSRRYLRSTLRSTPANLLPKTEMIMMITVKLATTDEIFMCETLC